MKSFILALGAFSSAGVATIVLFYFMSTIPGIDQPGLIIPLVFFGLCLFLFHTLAKKLGGN